MVVLNVMLIDNEQMATIACGLNMGPRAKRSISWRANASIAVDQLYDNADFYTSLSRAKFAEVSIATVQPIFVQLFAHIRPPLTEFMLHIQLFSHIPLDLNILHISDSNIPQ